MPLSELVQNVERNAGLPSAGNAESGGIARAWGDSSEARTSVHGSKPPQRHLKRKQSSLPKAPRPPSQALTVRMCDETFRVVGFPSSRSGSAAFPPLSAFLYQGVQAAFQVSRINLYPSVTTSSGCLKKSRQTRVGSTNSGSALPNASIVNHPL